ncbi:hypothetical protein DL765_011652 [Monosporascus sp. GIB2]|nr:hypothetical protein DL765_011652 [Monosporascus sp. GIB2]
MIDIKPQPPKSSSSHPEDTKEAHPMYQVIDIVGYANLLDAMDNSSSGLGWIHRDPLAYSQSLKPSPRLESVRPQYAMAEVHVKELTSAWPHLQILSDFMETTVTPQKWRDLYDPPNGKEPVKQKNDKIEEQQLERAKKTKVCRLDYYASGKRKHHPCDDKDQLQALFDDDAGTDGQDGRTRLQLYVIEDLSRDVIEIFGSKFDVDPSFFRSHLVDYAWCNIRDLWRDPPSLYTAAQQQSWFQLRFAIPRYFATTDSFNAGTKEAEAFNVFRRLDDDRNKSRWDEKAIVGIMRTRASFWLRPVNENQAENLDRTDIGILLLDPTVQQGLPLWRHYRNWKTPPPMGGGEDHSEERFETRKTFFDDFVHWVKASPVFDSTKGPSPSPDGDSLLSEKLRWANAGLPLQALLHRICSEWLTMADYVKTRLNQVELEVSSPEHFLANGTRIDNVLTKLHTWRRSIPVYREMLEETLETVFGVSSRLSTLLGSSLDAPDPRWNSGRRTMCLHVGRPGNLAGDVKGVSAYRYDFALALAHMEEHQKRIDRLASIVTAAINIEDARRGYAANKNVNRLTLLATLFVPLSLVASLLSMQPDVERLRNTAVLWAEVAIPSAFGVWLIAKILNPAWFQRQTQPLRDRSKEGWARKGGFQKGQVRGYWVIFGTGGRPRHINSVFPIGQYVKLFRNVYCLTPGAPPNKADPTAFFQRRIVKQRFQRGVSINSVAENNLSHFELMAGTVMTLRAIRNSLG